MGVIKRADIEDYTRQALVMDLDDLEKRGRNVIQAANAEAENILRMANAKRDQMLATAEKQGYEKGQRDGYEQGYIDGVVNGVEDSRQDHNEVLAQLTEVWTIQLEAFEQHRNSMLEHARTQVVELATMIAEKVIKREIEIDPYVVTRQIEAALSSMTESSRLVISVHPDDVELSRSEIPAILEKFAGCEHAQVVTDPSLQRGSCVATTINGGMIDASIDQQLDRIVEALLPDGNEIEGVTTSCAMKPIERRVKIDKKVETHLNAETDEAADSSRHGGALGDEPDMSENSQEDAA